MTVASLGFDVSEVRQVAAEFDASVPVVQQRSASVVRHYGNVLRARVRGHASGRPGPRVQTGDYRRSINVRTRFTTTRYDATVGTNEPQGRRLENGFHGADALGRIYDQQPYPHFGPGLDDVESPFVDSVAAVVVVGPIFLPGVDRGASNAARAALRREQR